LFDIRQTEPLQSLKAHDSGVNCIALSSQVTNMFVSASEDENVKIWDIKQGSFELIHEKKLKIVNIFFILGVNFKAFNFKSILKIKH
jgi:WD40 repeat protein